MQCLATQLTFLDTATHCTILSTALDVLLVRRRALTLVIFKALCADKPAMTVRAAATLAFHFGTLINLEATATAVLALGVLISPIISYMAHVTVVVILKECRN